MIGVEIFFTEDSDLSEYEAINKGYRLDVFVKIHQNIYRVSVYTILRLQQDFETEVMEDIGFYRPDPNLVLVKNSNKDEIIRTINWLVKQEYFSHLKNSSSVDINELVKVQ
ncbi:MAG: hypothetical protein FWC90_00475 [Oscillospiraceae bacterium]|nr:hypothetical protein [Oscillospiraceae bacterium]